MKGCTANRPAQRRYLKRVMIFSALYLAAIFAAETIVTEPSRFAAANIALALMPGLAIIGVFWAIGRLIVEETDEFMRMLIVRQTLIATAFALSLATVWGFLETYAGAPHIMAYWVAIAWFFGQFVGAAMNRITYGTWGSL